MNKKELSEIRRNLSDTSDLLVINRITMAFVDGDKEIKCTKTRPFHLIPREEADCILLALKKVLTGTLGKGLLEYQFPLTSYEEGAQQYILHEVMKSKLDDETAVQNLLLQISEELEYPTPYAIMLGSVTYTVFNKTKNDEADPYKSQEFHFLLGAICPVEVRVDGLVYKESEAAIIKKMDYDRVVAEVPTDGFMYPTFTGRAPDVNHVLYFTKKSKEVNISMVENVLGCEFVATAEQERAVFQNMLQEVVADELCYDVVTGINDKLRDIQAEYANDPEPPVIDDIHVRDILLDSGVSQEKAEAMQNVYKTQTGENPLHVTNLLDNHTKITTPGITLTLKNDCTNKVHIRMENGRRYLLIDLDDPELEINGSKLTVTEQIPEEIPADSEDSATE